MQEQIARPLRRLYEEVISCGKMEIIDDLYSSNYINHAAPFGLSRDLSGLKRLFGIFHQAFPDQHIEAEEIYVIQDRVIARWTLTATHRGHFVGVPPTNRAITMTGIDIERIENGRIAEHWGGEDMLGLLQQIGAVPHLKI